ncbi:MAG: exonuclease domain-containing protein [Candidatus Methanoperedens sp.]|nr:exonuclease domain-containing protein [Candidatus Methanoperedens sp.]
MDFVAIDFETANEKRNSVCELGVAIVEDDKIVESKSWLIRPPELRFNPFNTSIHGISEKDVVNQLEFDALWDEIKYYLDGNLVIAHNASFDLSVLRTVLDSYSIPYPDLKYTCSYIISKKVWKGLLSYNLKNLANMLSVELEHHHAFSDANVCASISVKAFQKSEICSIEEIENKLGIKIGELYLGGYKPSTIKQHRDNERAQINSDIKIEKLQKDDYKSSIIKPERHYKNLCVLEENKQIDPSHPFYGKTFVFTGALQAMIRSEAQKLVLNKGGFCGTSICSSTNYLVMGVQDLRKVGEDGKSSKTEKAEKLLSKGVEIELMNEDDFLRML